jgi:hypothetical protein
MRLINRKTGAELAVGDNVVSFGGTPMKLTQIDPMRNRVRAMGADEATDFEFFPGVFRATSATNCAIGEPAPDLRSTSECEDDFVPLPLGRGNIDAHFLSLLSCAVAAVLGSSWFSRNRASLSW